MSAEITPLPHPRSFLWLRRLAFLATSAVLGAATYGDVVGINSLGSSHTKTVNPSALHGDAAKQVRIAEIAVSDIHRHYGNRAPLPAQAFTTLVQDNQFAGSIKTEPDGNGEAVYDSADLVVNGESTYPLILDVPRVPGIHSHEAAAMVEAYIYKNGLTVYRLHQKPGEWPDLFFLSTLALGFAWLLSWSLGIGSMNRRRRRHRAPLEWKRLVKNAALGPAPYEQGFGIWHPEKRVICDEQTGRETIAFICQGYVFNKSNGIWSLSPTKHQIEGVKTEWLASDDLAEMVEGWHAYCAAVTDLNRSNWQAKQQERAAAEAEAEQARLQAIVEQEAADAAAKERADAQALEMQPVLHARAVAALLPSIDEVINFDALEGAESSSGDAQ